MTRKLLLPFLFLLSLGALAQEVEGDSASSAQLINLTLGLEQVVTLPNNIPRDIELRGDYRKVTSATHDKSNNTIRFVPRAQGFATLTIHDQRGRMIYEYRIDVKKSNLDKIIKEVKALIGDIDGITIKVINNRVVVDGQVLLPKDLGRIANVLAQYDQSQVSSLVTLSPLAMRKIAEFIARDINNPEIEVKALNDKIILSGWANDKEEKAKAELIAKMYLPDVVVDPAEEKGVVRKRRPINDGVINLINVKAPPAEPQKKMVQIVVHFVELNKEYAKSFNFQFTPSLQDETQMRFSSGSSSGTTTELTGIVTNLLPKLNWAKSHGHGRVLESFTIMTEDGKPARIESNSSFPVQVTQPNGSTTINPINVPQSVQ
ncbi:MAG: BON domain-containing protein, partial [Bdellovibrionaceae bacterium]|nr:BON domain-containing protein [Pseudobdellovibrionaceae bacterium]